MQISIAVMTTNGKMMLIKLLGPRLGTEERSRLGSGLGL